MGFFNGVPDRITRPCRFFPLRLWIHSSVAVAPLRSSHARRNPCSLDPAPRALVPPTSLRIHAARWFMFCVFACIHLAFNEYFTPFIARRARSFRILSVQILSFFFPNKKPIPSMGFLFWRARQDLNLRPLESESNALSN